MVQRKKEKDKGEEKIYVLFIELKAAFDNVNRNNLGNNGRKRSEV